MAQQVNQSRTARLLPMLWILGLMAMAIGLWFDLASPIAHMANDAVVRTPVFALWSDIASAIAPWRRAVATALLVLAMVSSVLWHFRVRLRQLFLTRSIVAIASVVPALLVWPLLRTADGVHIWDSCRQACQMAAELESAVKRDIDSYRTWHRKWEADRSRYELQFPSIARRLKSAEDDWGDAFAHWMGARINYDARKALDELADARVRFSDMPVIRYVDQSAPGIQIKIVDKVAGDLTSLASRVPQNAIEEIDRTERKFHGTVVSKSLGGRLPGVRTFAEKTWADGEIQRLTLLARKDPEEAIRQLDAVSMRVTNSSVVERILTRAPEVRAIAEQAWADGEIQRLMSLARQDPDEALRQLDATSTRVTNSAVVERIITKAAPVRDLAMFGIAIRDLRHTNQQLVAQTRYQEALAAVENLRDQFRTDGKKFGRAQELDKLVDEYAFVVELHQLAIQATEP
jgi:hypothetical protein